jgi:hypothetical protein
MGSSFTGGLPAVAAVATMHHAGRGEQQDFPRAEPYAILGNDTIECLTLAGARR